ncbi:hypothetical protein NDU88_001348 [Pleurodeles waltl]|uniref:Uncharacterized protein n=1 Tax=Pleurodeles waltl TaxID=8319 RepID=A0AAV7P6S9_PLEWA|nr:hypothetical protein NDU88_001348 [Pleurodeles waltl]
MRVRTHEHRKRTASSERVSARSYGLLPLHTGGDFNDKGRLKVEWYCLYMLYCRTLDEVNNISAFAIDEVIYTVEMIINHDGFG